MASFTKLKSGEWGVRVEGSAREGQVLTVTKRDGSTQSVTVSKVVFSGNGIALCAIAGSESNSGRSSGRARKSGWPSGGRCRECRGPIRDASHHRAMGGLCGGCAFDEYDC